MSERTIAAQPVAASALNASRNVLLQRQCACGTHTVGGGECAECSKKKSGMQRKLAIGSSSDPLELEADRVADRVMAVPEHANISVAPLRIQRYVGSVEDAAGAAPASVDRVLAVAGRPLEPALRHDMGQRFGHDFSKVRVHSSTDAEQSARDVNAKAYTVGNNIVFGAGQFAPGTQEGRRLIAHELTHVVQQQNVTSHPVSGFGSEGVGMAATQMNHNSGSKVAAISSALSQPINVLQRMVKVDKPSDLIDNPTGKGLVQTNAQTVQGYLQTLCSGGAVAVSKVGVVGLMADFCPKPMPAGFMGPLAPSPADKSKEPTGCGCLCDLVNSVNDYTIVIDDKDWPHTLGRVVTTPSPNSPKLWGAATVSGKVKEIDPWLVLGHEFCGHAWLAELGLPDTNATRGEGGHQETVGRENELRKEHGIEARGSFKDPFCGESFWRLKAGPGPVEWSSYLKTCEAWRTKTYGGKYKISDKIP